MVDHESKNKMGRTNLVSLFAPTLMTVNADAVSDVLSLSLLHMISYSSGVDGKCKV